MELNQTVIPCLAGSRFTPSVKRNTAGVNTPAGNLLWNGPQGDAHETVERFWPEVDVVIVGVRADVDDPVHVQVQVVEFGNLVLFNNLT